MNPGLASTILKLSRPESRGGFSFVERSAGATTGATLRARRTRSKDLESFEAGRERDKQTAVFSIRTGDFLSSYIDGDELIEEITSGIETRWQVKKWHHIAGTRGLWLSVSCEENEAPQVDPSPPEALTYAGENLTYAGENLLY